MCLIITAAATVITTFMWYFNEKCRKYKIGMLTLTYWGAVIMWSVDSLFSMKEGEPILDFSTDDTLLGMTVVICGLAAWIAYLLIKASIYTDRTGQHKK